MYWIFYGFLNYLVDSYLCEYLSFEGAGHVLVNGRYEANNLLFPLQSTLPPRCQAALRHDL